VEVGLGTGYDLNLPLVLSPSKRACVSARQENQLGN
jgi:hypothetical protein